MKYNVGDKVRIKSLDWYNKNKTYFKGTNFVDCGRGTFTDEMVKYCGEVVTIESIDPYYGCYFIKEDKGCWLWSDEMIECKGEEEVGLVDKLSSRWVNEFNLPDGYIFKDENGNVINATKIVLEKKKKDVILTQVDTKVHECCILFCKHCGCGVLRDICTSLGTCKEHDEYRTAIRAYLMEENKR